MLDSSAAVTQDSVPGGISVDLTEPFKNVSDVLNNISHWHWHWKFVSELNLVFIFRKKTKCTFPPNSNGIIAAALARRTLSKSQVASAGVQILVLHRHQARQHFLLSNQVWAGLQHRRFQWEDEDGEKHQVFIWGVRHFNSGHGDWLVS